MKSEWTPGTLKEYVDKRFESVQVAAEKLERETKENKAQANEWRGAMNDKDERYALKADTERIEGDVKNLQLSEAKLAGKADAKTVIWVTILSLASLAMSAIALFK